MGAIRVTLKTTSAKNEISIHAAADAHQAVLEQGGRMAACAVKLAPE
jgi:hypothetical protein